jgi:hypothetical protein
MAGIQLVCHTVAPASACAVSFLVVCLCISLLFLFRYGRRFQAGDIVSVLLDYGKRRIAFYVNHEFINVASREAGLLQRKLHLAAALAYEGDQLTLLPPTQWPPKPSALSNEQLQQ